MVDKPRKPVRQESDEAHIADTWDHGYNTCMDDKARYEAWQVDKVGGLFEALENIIQHIEISSKPFAQFSSVSMIAKQALAKYKEGE